jgi:hypothetical protein
MYDEAWLAARRATAIDPGHSLGTAVQGLVRLNQLRFVEARVLLERSVTQSIPADNAFLWLAIVQSITGDFDSALATLEGRLEASPAAPNLLRWRDQVLSNQGRWQEIWENRGAVSAVEMEQTVTTQQLAGVMIGETDVEEFIAWGRSTYPNMSPEDKTLVGLVADRVANESSEPLEPSTADRIWNSDSQFVISLSYLLPANTMISYIQRVTVGLAERPNTFELGFFWTDGMSELRKRPETLQLFRDVGLPAYWDLYGWPPMCRRVDAHDFDCD